MKHVFSFFIYFLVFSHCFSLQAYNNETTTFLVEFNDPSLRIQAYPRVRLDCLLSEEPVTPRWQASEQAANCAKRSHDLVTQIQQELRNIEQFKLWGVGDFENQMVRNYGRNWREVPKSYQKKILEDYRLYQFAAYRNLMATLPGYEAKIIELHQEVLEEEVFRGEWYGKVWRKMRRVWWDRCIGFFDESFPTIVKKEYEEIQRREARREAEAMRKKQEQYARAKQEKVAKEVLLKKQAAERAEREQRIVQEKIKEQELAEQQALAQQQSEVKWVHGQSLSGKQKEVFQRMQEKHEYLDSCSKKYYQVLQQSGISGQEAERLRQRIKAIIQTVEDNGAFESISYPFSQQVVDFLYTSCLESEALKGHDNSILIHIIDNKCTTLDGLPIQHCIQQEIMTALDTVADIHCSQAKNSITLLHTEAIGQMCYMASEYVQEGLIPLAMKIVDHPLIKNVISLKDDFMNGVIYTQEQTIEKLYGVVKEGAQSAKGYWQQKTRGIDSGLKRYGIAIVDGGIIDMVEGAAGLLETGGHLVKAVENGALISLTGKGVAGIKTIGVKAWDGIKEVDKGITYAYHNSEETANMITDNVSDLALSLYEIKQLPMKDMAYNTCYSAAEKAVGITLDFVQNSYHNTSRYDVVQFGAKTVSDIVTGKAATGLLRKVAPLVTMAKMSTKKHLVQSSAAIVESNVAASATRRLLPAVIDKARPEYSPLLMRYPSTVAVRMAVAETVETTLVTEVAHVVEDKVVVNTAQRLLLAVIDKKASKEAANLFTRVSCRSEACKAVHAIHSKKELRNALIHLRNNPLSIAFHELLPFDKPIIDTHGLMHMLGIEVKKGWDKKIKSLKKKLAGFHFNPNGRMDKYLSDVVVDEATGIVKATVTYGGLKPVKDKTFFPSSWTIEKLLDEMQAALLNVSRKPEVSGNRILCFGKTSCGIEIQMVFEKTGKLVTAFPLFKK